MTGPSPGRSRVEHRTRHGVMRGVHEGSGPVLVLLHASLHDRDDWLPVRPALARQHSVVSLDWLGHGESDVPATPLSAPILADALEDVLAAYEGPLSLIGNSVGGFAAARYAARFPDRVERLVLVNAGGFERHTPASHGFCRAMGRPAISRRTMGLFARGYMRCASTHDRRVLARVRDRARTAEGAAAVSALWRSFPTPAHDLRDEARAIACPTMLVWGTKDIAVPTASGRRAADVVPGARWAPMATGHLPFSSDPAGFLDLVQPFLEPAA